MSSQFHNRLVGTIVLVALGVIFLPDMLDGKQPRKEEKFAEIPLRPATLTQSPPAQAFEVVSAPEGGDDYADLIEPVINSEEDLAQAVKASPASGAKTDTSKLAAKKDETKSQTVSSDKNAAKSDALKTAAVKPKSEAEVKPKSEPKSEPKKEVVKTATAKTDSAPSKQTAAVKTEKAKPEAAKTEVTKTPVAKAETAKVESTKTDKPKETVKVEASKADVAKTSVAKTDTAKVDTTNTDKPKETVKTAAKEESPKVATSSKAGLTLQLGAFSSADNVKSLVAQLRKSGYKAYTVPESPKDGALTKVFVGPDVSEAKLKKTQEEIETLTRLKGRIIPFNPLES